MRRATVVLPHGLSMNGSWLRLAELRELNGNDEAQMLESRGGSVLSRSIALLERVVDFGEKSESDEGAALVTRLTMGDFTALILRLNDVNFGGKLYCLITCPACKEDMSVDLTVNELLEAPIAEPKAVYQVEVGGFALNLRPATAADVAAIAEKKDDISPAERLVRSCIIQSEPPLPSRMDGELLEKISSKLSELDPQADLVLDLTCPSCNHRFNIPFFPEDFLLREIDARRSQLEREVHWLAFNYHWSEEAILTLPATRRKRYVELINRTLSGEGA